MSSYSVIRLQTVDALRRWQFAWDDLWWRSEATWPTLRAELVAQWVERFAPQGRFEALAVEHEGTWLAALPLVRHRYGLLSVASVPNNPWAPCGELLLDTACDAPAVIEALLATLRTDGGLLWLDGVCIQAARWRQVAQRCLASGAPCYVRPGAEVGWLQIDGDWEGYKASLSRSHRQAMAKAARRLEKVGRAQLDVHWEIAPNELPQLLRCGFQVEDRSWKGVAGSSVLRSPGMFGYYLAQATQLALWRQLVLVWLRLDGRPIAFLYGYWAKSVLHAFKIGYDPQYAAYSPGQLLFYYLLERVHYEGQCRAVDFMGPRTAAIERWRPASYVTGRVAIAVGGLSARMAVWGYRHLWPAFRRLRDVATPSSSSQQATYGGVSQQAACSSASPEAAPDSLSQAAAPSRQSQ